MYLRPVPICSPRFGNLWCTRLQNSPYFCVFEYARAVKQKVWNEAENRERDWGETLLRHALPISLLILRKKPPVLQSNGTQLNRVNFTKSLGVLIDENLMWSNISYQGNYIKKNFSGIGSIKNKLATVFLLQPCIISITG